MSKNKRELFMPSIKSSAQKGMSCNEISDWINSRIDDPFAHILKGIKHFNEDEIKVILSRESKGSYRN